MTRWLAPAPSGSVEPGQVPTFSVIIPTYQMADLVADAVTSALEQTPPPHEVIVCDDGSTDDTQSVLTAFGDRIRVIRKRNGGLASAKNAAAEVATGEFVAVLDADDVYLPGRLEKLGELAAARPDLDLLNTDVFLDRDGTFVSRLTDHVPFPVTDQRAELLRTNFMWSGAAIRRARLAAIGGFDASVDFADDWDCWIRLVFSGSWVGLVDQPLALYRIHERAMSADRVRDFAGRSHVLERAQRDQPLTPTERAVAARSLQWLRNQHRLADAEHALVTDRAGARRALLGLGLARGVAVPTRAKALVAAAVPGAARRWLGARAGRGRQSYLTRPVPAPPRRR